MDEHWLMLLASILLTGLAQGVLRYGARPSTPRLRASLAVPLGFGTLLAVTWMTSYAMRAIPLSVSTAWSGLTYPWVMVLAWGALRERVTGSMVAGCALIVVGLAVFSLPG